MATHHPAEGSAGTPSPARLPASRRAYRPACRPVRLAVAVFVVSLGWVPLLPAEGPADAQRGADALLTPETQAAIDRALGVLGARQHDDGSFGSGQYDQNVAVSALAGMAFLASGSTPGRGPHGTRIDRCLNFILDHTQQSGFIVVDGSSDRGPMYGHGFATLFMAESYGMSARADLRQKLTKATRLIIDSQNHEGGWRYQPRRHDADISVTVCQVMALRAARNAGIYVPHATIDRSIEYVKQSQNPDGGFRYMLSGGPSAFPRSAAGVVALYSAGIYDAPEIERGIDYLMQHVPQGTAPIGQGHFFYGHYYAVQALWHASGNHWLTWYPAIRDALLAQQRPDGSWLDDHDPDYATAMACLILGMPSNFLPIFQR